MKKEQDVAFDFAIVGELNLDFVLYGVPSSIPEEREVLASGFAMTLGSSSAILAHNLAVLGSRVMFISRAGEDMIGETCCKRLQQAGVDTSNVVRDAANCTGVTFVLPLTATRRIVTYPGAMFEMGVEDVDLEQLSLGTHFHLSSLFLHRKLSADIPFLFAATKARGMTTSLDTNDDPEDKWGPIVEDTLAFVDILFCNERELQKISGIPDIERAAHMMSKKVSVLALKRGKRGASVFFRSGSIDAAPIEVPVVDTIGAGDSFNAGFLHKFVQGATLEECLAFGNITGAFSTTCPGGTEAFLDSTQVKDFLSKHGSFDSMNGLG